MFFVIAATICENFKCPPVTARDKVLYRRTAEAQQYFGSNFPPKKTYIFNINLFTLHVLVWVTEMHMCTKFQFNRLSRFGKKTVTDGRRDRHGSDPIRVLFLFEPYGTLRSIITKWISSSIVCSCHNNQYNRISCLPFYTSHLRPYERRYRWLIWVIDNFSHH